MEQEGWTIHRLNKLEGSCLIACIGD